MIKENTPVGTGATPVVGPGAHMSNMVLEIARLLKDRKARDIMVLDLNGLTSVTDYFIICTVNSSVQIKALIRFIEEFMKGSDLKLKSRNISYNSPWVLLDYNYFVIHLFLREGRDYYQLEKLWSDANVLYSEKGSFL
jgi:ribosome-associated protein